MEWVSGVWPIAAIVIAMSGLFGMFWWLSRCRHPNPHYRPAATHRDPMTGSDEVVEPAIYTCYECGKSWRALVRDAAWAPTGIRQRFAGYDPALAERATTRAAIISQQQQILAASRTGPTRVPPPVSKRRTRRKAWGGNVTDINTRRPA